MATDNILYCCVVTREKFRVGVLNFDIDTLMSEIFSTRTRDACP